MNRATRYWPAGALVLAVVAGAGPVTASAAHQDRDAPVVPSVGALFAGDDHFCTAGVVGPDVLITAAHCVHDGAPRTGLTFVPGLRDGTRPYGTWAVTAVHVDPAWADRADPAADVAILTVAPTADGRRIADVTGANTLGTSPAGPATVTIAGYPSGTDRPRICVTGSRREAADRLRFDCPGFPDGTSGGPWLAEFDPARGTGSVIGVIGGHQEGGDTPDTSYSPPLTDAVHRLYEQATAR